MVMLSIGVLGSLQIMQSGTPVVGLESDKVRALLAYLAVESDRPHRRDALVGLFWPGFTEESARHNLRQALFNLRASLGDHTSDTPYLLVRRDEVQFNRQSNHVLDMAQFDQYFYSRKDTLSQRGEDCSSQPGDLEEMVKLYRGDFLQGLSLPDSSEFDQWVLVQRENIHQRVLEAHTCLANYYELNADYDSARRHALRQLELDSWREEAHRQLMRVLALSGQRNAALAQYETCRQVLADELDVEPSEETRELNEQIRLGTLEAQPSQRTQAQPAPVFSLPVQLTPFVGRERELDQLGKLLADKDCRCLTLVGPGGIGKTRLALQAAADHFKSFNHGIVFVPLAAINSMAGVIPAIANSINLSYYSTGDPKSQLLNYLRERQMLLILDNVEQLLTRGEHQEDFALFVVDLLKQAPGINLLVTTREALNLQEEWVFDVQGLAFPETDVLSQGDEFDAVSLFVQRARRTLPHFTLTDQNRGEVAHICRLVEGMPLAIELAATWMRTLSTMEIAEEIEKSMDFLSTNMVDLPERHRSMRIVFDRSWQMLSTDEQEVLSRLSVFRGGFQRQAAEQVAQASLSVLSLLVNRTLMRRMASGRYDLHELVRQYCAAHLAGDSQKKEAVQKRHFNYYLAMAERADLEVKGPRQLEWLGRLEQDHDNLRAGLEWSLSKNETFPGEDEQALKLGSALRWFWRMRGHFQEGSDWLVEVLKRYPEKHTLTRAKALLGLSLLFNAMGDLRAARAPAEACVAIFRELDNPAYLAEALVIEGITLLWHGDSVNGLVIMKEALDIYRKLDDRWGLAHVLYRLGGYLSDYAGDPAGATMLEESASILEILDEKYLYTSVLIALGLVEMSHGEYPIARLDFERGLAATREIRHPWGIADALTNLGCLDRIQGDYMGAQSFFEESLRVYQEHGRMVWETDVMCAMAENEILQGNLQAGRSHLQSALTLLGASENKWLQVLVCYFQGLLAYYEGNFEQAELMLEETRVLAQTGQFLPDLSRSLLGLGRVKLKQGELDSAREYLMDGLRHFHKFGQKLGMVQSIEALASWNVARDVPEQAVRLFAIAQCNREKLGAPLPPVDRLAYETEVNMCRSRLGESKFTQLAAQSSSMPFEDVISQLLEAEER